MDNVIKNIREDLRKNSDEKTRTGGQRYFKETVSLYGVKTAAVGKICSKYFPLIKDLEKSEIFRLCQELWQSGFLEETFIACDWSFRIRSTVLVQATMPSTTKQHRMSITHFIVGPPVLPR